MCGIVGFFSQTSSPPLEPVLLKMADAIKHRGPDDYGVWAEDSSGIGLAHRRLSILDLSSAGHQPMISSSGRYVIVFNGEIYNHQDLRIELEDHQLAMADWKGRSDTETLLACIEAWGFEIALKKSVGMFAAALWDRKERCLTLARDRLGEKPLYYGWQGNVFLFTSELKALKQHPDFKSEIDRDALALQMRYNNVPTPYSIYRGIKKLTPGTLLKLSTTIEYFSSNDLPEPIPYWSLAEKATFGQETPFAGDEIEAVQALDHVLRNSVRQQMVADVPLGAFLSGGVDSSMVVALMQAQSHRPVKTFTIGFNEKSYNEAIHAKEVAQHLGTEHIELYVSPSETMDIIPRLHTLYDEPFADSSQIATFLVSQLTRQYVTVSLSGDGGDEIFGGYNRYTTAINMYKKSSNLPLFTRTRISQLMRTVPDSTWNFWGQLFNVAHASEKMPKVLEILSARNLEEVYQRLVSHWKNSTGIVIGGTVPPSMLTDKVVDLDLPDFEHRMMYMDSVNYLQDDILVKVDRAAMGVSLETRIPFLDHRVVEFAWKLPLRMRIRNGQGKWILKQMLYEYVPKKLIERPKAGFALPIASWLRDPLRDWAEDLLSESRLKNEGYLHSDPIRKKWSEHISGKRNWHKDLWNVLMFQSWHQG